jgi:hypothetical protein
VTAAGAVEDKCMKNCLAEKAKKFLFQKFILRRLMGKRGLDAKDVTNIIQCKRDCEDDPASHYCTEDKRFCDQVKMFHAFGPVAAHRVMEWVCDTETGVFDPSPRFISQCALLNGKCVVGPDGEPRCEECPAEPSPNTSTPFAVTMTPLATSITCAQAEQKGASCDTTDPHLARPRPQCQVWPGRRPAARPASDLYHRLRE